MMSAINCHLHRKNWSHIDDARKFMGEPGANGTPGSNHMVQMVTSKEFCTLLLSNWTQNNSVKKSHNESHIYHEYMKAKVDQGCNKLKNALVKTYLPSFFENYNGLQ